jgi:hypothetical protein
MFLNGSNREQPFSVHRNAILGEERDHACTATRTQPFALMRELNSQCKHAGGLMFGEMSALNGNIFQIEHEVACECTAFAKTVHTFFPATDVWLPMYLSGHIGTSPLQQCRTQLMAIRIMPQPVLLRFPKFMHSL